MTYKPHIPPSHLVEAARLHPETPSEIDREVKKTEVSTVIKRLHPIELLTPQGPIVGFLERYNGPFDGKGEIVFRFGDPEIEAMMPAFTIEEPDEYPSEEVDRILDQYPDALAPDVMTTAGDLLQKYEGMRLIRVDGGVALIDDNPGNPVTFAVGSKNPETLMIRTSDQAIGDNTLRMLNVTTITEAMPL